MAIVCMLAVVSGVCLAASGKEAYSYDDEGLRVYISAVQPKDGEEPIVTTITDRGDGSYDIVLTRPGSRVPIEKLARPIAVRVPSAAGDVVLEEAGSKIVLGKSLVESDGALCLLDGSKAVRVIWNAKPFDDVPGGAWYESAVNFVSSHELFVGVTHSRFCPDTGMTRAMLITILHRLEGRPAADGHIVYGDVAQGLWYSDAVAWGSAAGIIRGYDDGRFCPDEQVTREQLAAILFRYMSSIGADTSRRGDISGFRDYGEVSAWAAEALRWAVEAGIMNGRGADELAPGGTATRAEVAAVMERVVRAIVS